MHWKSTYKHPEGHRFTIEYERVWEAIGAKYDDVYYLLGFDHENREFYNCFHAALDIAQEIAFDEFDVPIDSWVESSEPTQYV